MQKRFKKYFWDGMENSLEHVILRRILEYASFPDILHFSFKSFKRNYCKIPIDKLRTDSRRVKWLSDLQPFIKDSNSWEEAIQKMLEPAFENIHKLFDYNTNTDTKES